jgi:hypothetical protein
MHTTIDSGVTENVLDKIEIKRIIRTLSKINFLEVIEITNVAHG